MTDRPPWAAPTEYDEIEPSEVRHGDTIGDSTVNHHPFVVEDINGPQKHMGIRQWTFEGTDAATGVLRTANFRESEEKVRRFAKGTP
jgi:hypothetical protein